MSNPLVEGKDLASITVTVAASAAATATAGGAGNNVAVTGLSIDRQNIQANGAAPVLTNVVPTGAMFQVGYECALGAGNTITLKNALVQDSADNTTWTTIYDQTGAAAPIPPSWPVAGVADTGGTGGTTHRGVMTYGTDIRKARRYVRFVFTPALPAAGTDTGKFWVNAVMSGIDEVPPGVV